MRLGAQPCQLVETSESHNCYGTEQLSERHRHRYEFNNAYRSQFVAHSMLFAGTSPDESLVEIIELPDHPWYVAVQFHPEFKSKPTSAHPLFTGFIGAAVKRHVQRSERSQDQETESSTSES